MSISNVDRLGERIAALAADLQAATCRWLALIAEFDRLEGWGAQGCRSCAEWVSWRCGMEPGAAREHVRVARRLEQLPLVRAKFAAGRLSYSKVRALTRVENVEREEELVELAQDATAAQLERLVRAYRGVVRVEQDPAAAFAERSLTWQHDADGCLVLRGRLPAEQGALVVAALEAAREHAADVPAGTPPAADGDGRERPPLCARNADALVALADDALAAAASATSSGGDRYQLVVHVDAQTLAGEQSGRCELEGGLPLARETARRLACDASLVRIVERDGRPLSIGRRTRSIPPALRCALRSRDGGCQFPGCTSTRHVDAHHLQHWSQGGRTDLTNLVMLCRHHHRLVHEGGFAIDGSPGALVFRTPSGRRLLAAPPLRRGACTPIAGVPAGTSLQPTTERMNLGYAVDALLHYAPPPVGREGGASPPGNRGDRASPPG